MKKPGLYIVVFLSGAAVLCLELLGTRIIGPFYGVSLYLWSALISITLIALSAGYAAGGRWADRSGNPNTLAIIICLAGLLVIIIPFIRNGVISLTGHLGLRGGVLLSTFILFFFPLALLGMISPFAVKLRTESVSSVGKSAGDLYAVSTIGSVLGALLTGFLLIPNLGVIKLTLSVGIVLILSSFLVFAPGKYKMLKSVSAMVLLLLLIFIILGSFGEKGGRNKGIVYLRQSPYAEIKVMDIDENRLLLIDGAIHTAINKNTGENLLQYVWVLDLVKYFREYAGDMLLIGLGGGSVQKSFYRDNWDVDVVEIDPAVTGTAYKYFKFDSSSAVVYHNDGREFLESPGKNYDLIILDAYGSGSIPFHLVTREAFRLAGKRLKPGGILALNVESSGWKDRLVTSVSATLKGVFKNVIVLPIAEPPNTLGNVIIAASDKGFKLYREIERDYRDPDYRFSAEYEMAHAWDNVFVPDMKGARIITDDLNPVDVWSETINHLSRRELHEALGSSSFLW